MNNMIDKRLVFRFDEGQMTFRHINHTASYEQLLTLANAINDFQEDAAVKILLVTVREF